jgi:outer membrane lipoprotein SlyB
MNAKLIVFSGIVTAAVGAGLGIVIANLAPTPYTDLYRHLDQKYAVIGAVAGLLVGASQESLRELKQQRDQEELNTRYPNKTILH